MLAALIADTGWYLAGRRFGMRILAHAVPRIAVARYLRAADRIDLPRFGPASMMFAKFVPGFASVATAMAGAVRLRYWKFVLFDAIGAGAVGRASASGSATCSATRSTT